MNVQRGGPSTGNPTKSEQSDLFQALYGTHGDAPRVVLACSDVEDCFHATVDAFNIAEEFQIPVLVLSDQAVGAAQGDALRRIRSCTRCATGGSRPPRSSSSTSATATRRRRLADERARA